MTGRTFRKLTEWRRIVMCRGTIDSWHCQSLIRDGNFSTLKSPSVLTVLPSILAALHVPVTYLAPDYTSKAPLIDQYKKDRKGLSTPNVVTSNSSFDTGCLKFKFQDNINITLGLDPITLSSPQRIVLLLNAILLPGCFSKTFIDIMFFSLLFYVFTFLFNMYRLLFTVILSRLTSCN